MHVLGGQRCPPFTFSASDRSSHHVAREDVDVVSTHLDFALDRAIERFVVELITCFALSVMLEACWFKRRSKSVTTFEYALEKGRSDLRIFGNFVLTTILARIALGKNNFSAIYGETLPTTAHSFIKLTKSLISKPLNLNTIFDASSVNFSTHKSAKSLD